MIFTNVFLKNDKIKTDMGFLKGNKKFQIACYVIFKN